jgi:nucleotidyltransferase substrate binding protein (TIGR01987 family)
MNNTLDYSSLQKAVTRLEESLNVVEEYKTSEQPQLIRTLISGVVQHFEFTYELSWKFIKRWLGENLGKSQVDGLSRQELFRLAAEYQLIDSVENWMLFHRARNETSHTYNENTADEVFKVAVQFLPEATKLLNALKSKD